MLLFERYEGACPVRVELLVTGTRLQVLETGQAARSLPPGALEATMQRYGKDLAETSTPIEELALPGGGRLWRFRYLPRFEVEPKDYLVYEQGDIQLCEVAETICAALVWLSRASEKG
ncbi:MAG: hypothetical protein MK135_00590 [Polyangiaceae bacterium]|nr:hypothetical protein [Polyangiaceae bacterium]